MLKPEHLITLREVVRLGSFAGAANRLGYTASAVSQQISALERETGVQLFHRTPRSVVPTEAAQIVARHAGTVLSDIDRLLTAAGQVQHRSGRILRIGAFPSFVTTVLPRILARLDERDQDGLRLSIEESSTLVHSLGSAGELDAAVVYQVGQAGLSWPSSLTRRWLAEDPFCIAYPSSWPHRPEPPYAVEQFTDLPWIMNRPGTGDASIIEALYARWGLHPRVVGHCDDFNATLTMVAAGLGAAPLPLLTTDTRPGVTVLRAPWLNVSRSIFALIRADRDSPQLTVLLDTFERVLASAPD